MLLLQYMRECILGNFRRRLLSVLKTDNDLQRPSVLESLIQRHVSIVHLAEQHISMDITQGIREVLLSESFSGPVSSLHLFEKPTDQHTGSATESVCNWYIENIIKDISGAGILFVPIHKCFKSTRPVGGYFADSVTDLRELQAFVRIFGGYGVDRLDRMLKEHTAALLNCIDTSLHAGDRFEREASMRQIVDLETLIGFCVQAGLALAFDRLLSEASGAVLEEGAPLIHSLLAGGSNPLQLSRCISAVIAGSEFVRLEREHQHRSSLSNVHASEGMDPELTGHVSAEASIKSTLQLFVKLSAEIILDYWSETHSYFYFYILGYVQISSCSTAYLPRPTLRDLTIPSKKLIGNSRQPRGDSTPQHYTNDSSGYFKGSSSHSQEHIYEIDTSNLRSMDNRQRNARRSGPLDYGASRNRVKSVEGSTSGSTGPSPLPRFAVSRSGPLAYK
ncbi:hypothetical protein Ahy_B04g070771 isoform G [Arachis hypogaea]|uniref:Protein NAP1 n=1 Tax=Arachis hypogaea TaxID=3818 RepID=A0A444ZJ68_ARAHY|nr:hypothetical protein Ahy_B04g070771 isoform G [Arachis hypogaea]